MPNLLFQAIPTPNQEPSLTLSQCTTSTDTKVDHQGTIVTRHDTVDVGDYTKASNSSSEKLKNAPEEVPHEESLRARATEDETTNSKGLMRKEIDLAIQA